MRGSAGTAGIGCIVGECARARGGVFPGVQNRNIRHDTRFGGESKVTHNARCWDGLDYAGRLMADQV
jgi:hypothetical protein